MTPAELVTLLMLLTPVPDRTSKHMPIPRREDITKVIATVCALESTVPPLCALNLDVLVYEESGGQRFIAARDGTIHEIAGDCPNMPAGDRDCTRERGAKSCGPFQTPCSFTPKGATALEQTRIAWHVLEKSTIGCPSHPLWMYASGECKWSKTAEDYEKIVQKHAAEIPP